MKTTFLMILAASTTLVANSLPVAITLPEDYSKTLNIQLNGRFVPNDAVLEKLSNTITDSHSPVVVLMPGKVSFDGWDEIRGLLDKIGCLNVRYFVFSLKTNAMTELELPHEAIAFTLNPPPKSSKNEQR
jgi:hypothetical protein